MIFKKNNNKGFSMVELLVVIAVIGIIASISYVNIQGAKEKANIVKVIMFSEDLGMKMDKNLIAEWKFDEGEGSIAYDSSGNGIHGEITTGANYDSDTVFESGSSLNFTGEIGSYVDLEEKLEPYLPKTPATLEVWAKGSFSNGNQIIFGDGRSQIALGLYKLSGRTETFIVRAGSGGKLIFEPKNNWKDNNWNHIVVSYDENFNPKFWTNGKEITDTPSSNNWSWSGSNALIGRRPGDSNPTAFKGLIDEIRIYDKELTLAEVQYRYYAGLNNLLEKNKIAKNEYQKRIIFQ